MIDRVYSITEVAASSEISHDNAISRAVERASETLRHVAWLEVKEQHASVMDGGVQRYQVILNIGFRAEG